MMPLGWIGNALIIFGAWQIGHKRRWGFLCAIAGGLFWAAEGVRLCKPDLIFIEVVMGLVAFRNFIKWKIDTHRYKNWKCEYPQIEQKELLKRLKKALHNTTFQPPGKYND